MSTYYIEADIDVHVSYDIGYVPSTGRHVITSRIEFSDADLEHRPRSIRNTRTARVVASTFTPSRDRRRTAGHSEGIMVQHPRGVVPYDPPTESDSAEGDTSPPPSPPPDSPPPTYSAATSMERAGRSTHAGSRPGAQRIIRHRRPGTAQQREEFRCICHRMAEEERRRERERQGRSEAHYTETEDDPFF